MAGISEADLKAIFDEFDSDNSNSIDAKELVNALKRVFGDERTDDEIKELAGAILAESDANNDQKISWEEFKKAALA